MLVLYTAVDLHDCKSFVSFPQGGACKMFDSLYELEARTKHCSALLQNRIPYKNRRCRLTFSVMIDIFVKIITSHKAVVFFFRFTRKRFFKLPCVSLYIKHISCAYLVTQLCEQHK